MWLSLLLFHMILLHVCVFRSLLLVSFASCVLLTRLVRRGAVVFGSDGVHDESVMFIMLLLLIALLCMVQLHDQHDKLYFMSGMHDVFVAYVAYVCYFADAWC